MNIGTERPFTFREFLNEVKDLAMKQNVEYMDNLDYFDVLCIEGNNKLDNSDFCIVSKTTFGGNEGIYADFYIARCGKEAHFATAKTLEESDDAFLGMSVMAAKVCLLANNYRKDNEDLFNWNGFDVSIVKAGEPSPYGWWCPTLENAKARAEEAKGNHPDAKVFIRDNSTRVKSEYTSG